ncbi:MAG TPA: DJ-1/PfpI family protein [Candidatus Acidoferrales bacterium]|nr:DJ-1/PfpI family protein [Candidatus Acidoferrales bacterium]
MPIITRLEGKRVLILMASEYEDSEFRDVAGSLVFEGAQTVIASITMDKLVGKKGEVTAIPDTTVDKVDINSFDAIYIPGGRSPAKLRDDLIVQNIVKEAFGKGLRIGALCHGPQVLISAGIVKNKTLTSYPTVGEELERAGANYTGKPVERDGNIITGTDPTAIAEFNTVFIQEIECCEVFYP